MKEIINEQYQKLYSESVEFRLFVEKMEKLSTNEIKAEFGVNNKVISSFLGLSKMPT